MHKANQHGGTRLKARAALLIRWWGSYFLPWDEKPAIRSALHRRRLRPHASRAGRYRHCHRHGQEQSGQSRQHGDGGPGHPSRIRSAQRRSASYREKSAALKSGRLEKFSLTATQAILYFDSFAPGDTVKLHFRLRAKYPIRARTFKSRVYEYYDPEVSALARPVQLEVK